MPKAKQWSIVDIHSAQKCDLRKDFFPDVVTLSIEMESVG